LLLDDSTALKLSIVYESQVILLNVVLETEKQTAKDADQWTCTTENDAHTEDHNRL
jgi:hypothetical protein